ncbi:short-chain dehydrogenase/reductase family protein [Macrophomina phaseolina]|uniref:Short-chain dehydrogenase/reductase family protein n=1 Tax=Macrophomina phaseolina TaxID=35725 RepID=A0ABQ8G2I4_9PEZI|nr:short-chain dehydrogenase/reductase family protein [Macrophomina phaseolina]
MPFLQIQARLHPPSVDLTGKIAIVTGANGGIGLETARQLLLLHAGTVVLAVRNMAKGEAAKSELLADKKIQGGNPAANIRVMRLDMADYQSVWEFANSIKVDLPALHILILNAAVANLPWSKTGSGHDQISQVNYFSNVMLLLELLPTLEATARRSGEPSRVTWVGSRSFLASKLSKSIRQESVIEFLDDPKKYGWFMRYPDSKLLSAAFVREFSKHQDPQTVVVNDMCPGMVDTSITHHAPAYFRKPMAALTKVTARTPEQGAWAVIHAAAMAGPDSHGKYLVDQKEISSYGGLKSAQGQRLRLQLWKETAAEMVQQGVALPAFMESFVAEDA